MRGAWLDSLSSKNSKKISKTIQTRSDPSGGGGFNRFAQSAATGLQSRGPWEESREQEERGVKREVEGSKMPPRELKKEPQRI